MLDIFNNLLVVAGQVVTLFLLMGVGFVMFKQNRLSPETLGQLSFLLLYIVIPCVIIDSLQVEPDEALLRNMLLMFLLTAGYYVVFCSLLPLLFRSSPEDTRAVLRFGTVYANNGFMGIPLLQAVLGPSTSIFAVVATVTFNISQWTHGVILMSGQKRLSIRQALLNPGTVGLAVGLVLFLSGLRLPSMVGNAVGFIADLNTPLAMVVIGGQMARTNLGSTFRRPDLYAVSILKLVAIPAVTALVLLPFHLPPLVYCSMVILAGTPTAGTSSILAQQFGRDAGSAAQMVTLSTLLSVLTLPVVAVAANLLS